MMHPALFGFTLMLLGALAMDMKAYFLVGTVLIVGILFFIAGVTPDRG